MNLLPTMVLVLITLASIRNPTTKCVFCVRVGELFDQPQLFEEVQQPIDVVDNLPESTEGIEVLGPVTDVLCAM